MNLATPIPLAEFRRQAKVSDVGFKRRGSAAPGADGNMEDHVEMQRIALEFSLYSSRRITAELRRRGWQGNRKKLRRIGENNPSMSQASNSTEHIHAGEQSPICIFGQSDMTFFRHLAGF